MVGSIGELIGAVEYGLTLATASNMGWDAIRSLPDGTTRTVEIKATQRKSVSVRHVDARCDELLVIRLNLHAGTWETIYAGPAPQVWELLAKTMPSNGQRQVSLTKLAELAPAQAFSDQG